MRFPLATLLALPLVLGCTSAPSEDDTSADSGPADTADSGDSGDTSDTGDTADTADTAADSGTITLTDAGNYAYAVDLDIASVPVAAGVSVDLDWSGVTHDLAGAALDPTLDISLVILAQFPSLTEAEVTAGLATDSLLQEDLGVYYSLPPHENTRANLGVFESVGHPFDAAELLVEGSGTWLVAVLPRGRSGAASLTFLAPGDAVPPDDIRLDADATTATAEATPGEPTPVTGDGPWSVRWDALTTSALGAPLSAHPLDNLTLYRFDGLDAEDLAARFLELEQIATDQYSTVFSGVEELENLSELKNKDAEPFPGFDASATWVLTLRCSTCTFPAPAYATVLLPEAP